jgi:DNA-binding response OmpR family regulator
MTRILLVEDDRDLCHLMKEYLVSEGMATTLSHDGKDVVDLALSGNYDIVVLDVVLPGGNGLQLLRTLRMISSIGIIMLTARTEEVDRVMGLDHGADDYVVKPCSPRELAARIRAILRRLKPSWDQNFFRRSSAGCDRRRFTGQEFASLQPRRTIDSAHRHGVSTS